MLSVFPQLADTEFREACNNLSHAFHLREHDQDHWTAVECIQQYETQYLRVTKELFARPRAVAPARRSDDIDEVIEDDDEELLVAPRTPQALINYDILLSSTYRVPTLYFHISDPQHRYPTTMTTLYEHLIPLQYKAQAENVGVMGGITIADHPLTNRPVFFIHPCQTAAVMEASIGTKEVTAYEYLLLWIGALGKCVGLDVPLTIARNIKHM